MYRARTIALLAAAAAVAVSCGGGSTAPSSAPPPAGGNTQATVTINITGQGGKLAFSPNPATVSAGQLVVFKNNDKEVHHVVLDDGSMQTADIAPGATSAPVAMGTSGSKTYHCAIHPGMVGGFNGATSEPPENCNQAYCDGYGGGD
jgi:plastocyanin